MIVNCNVVVVLVQLDIYQQPLVVAGGAAWAEPETGDRRPETGDGKNE